jgi:hypothetical protein
MISKSQTIGDLDKDSMLIMVNALRTRTKNSDHTMRTSFSIKMVKESESQNESISEPIPLSTPRYNITVN